MKNRSISYTALGIVVGSAVGILMFLQTGQIWWFAVLLTIGLTLSAGMNGAKQKTFRAASGHHKKGEVE